MGNLIPLVVHFLGGDPPDTQYPHKHERRAPHCGHDRIQRRCSGGCGGDSRHRLGWDRLLLLPILMLFLLVEDVPSELFSFIETFNVTIVNGISMGVMFFNVSTTGINFLLIRLCFIIVPIRIQRTKYFLQTIYDTSYRCFPWIFFAPLWIVRFV